MLSYQKPIVLLNEDLAEGVYAASGGGDDCYTASASITQTPEGGRENYCIHADGKHDADHQSSQQILILYFNQPVTYVSSNGTYVSGNGTNVLKIKYTYWNNPTDNIGLGDVYVTSAAGLVVNSTAELICNHHEGDL